VAFGVTEERYLILRNLLLGFELNEEELEIVEKLNTPELRKLFRKIFIPELGKEIPLGQSIDLWMTIQIPDMYQVQLQLSARELLIEYLNQALELIKNPNGAKVDLAINFISPDTHKLLIARNNFITHIETQLLVMKALAMAQTETPEERSKRLKKNSLK
jgi:hypothetical protein